jgi:hypothetical protein
MYFIPPIILRYLVFGLFIALYTTCRSQADSLFFKAQASQDISIFIREKGIIEPDRHNIHIQKKYKKWYVVEYQNSRGRIAQRRIHQHRIKKFLRRFEKLNQFGTVSEPQHIECGLSLKENSVQFSIPMDQKKNVMKCLRILKVWADKPQSNRNKPKHS